MVQTLFQLCVLGSILALGIHAMPSKFEMIVMADKPVKTVMSAENSCNLTCRDNGVLFAGNGVCYVYVETLYTKDQQEDNCLDLYISEQFGPWGYVAFSEDALMNAFLRDYLKKVVKDPKLPIWLGADATPNQHCSFFGCSGSGYYWTWQDKDDIDYTNFAPGQDGNADGSYGIALIPESGYWIRADSDNTYATICQSAPIETLKFIDF